MVCLLTYSTGFCESTSPIYAMVDNINETCPINWDYGCTINSISFSGSTVAIRMDYNDKTGDFSTTFRDEVRKNKDKWVLSMYKISSQWKNLLDECLANEITLTVLIYSQQGGFSLKVFPEQIQKVQEMMDSKPSGDL